MTLARLDLLQTIYTFQGLLVMWDHAIGIDSQGLRTESWPKFVGENGTLVIDRGGWEVIPEKVNGQARMGLIPLKRYTERVASRFACEESFWRCIKSRNRVQCRRRI